MCGASPGQPNFDQESCFGGRLCTAMIFSMKRHLRRSTAISVKRVLFVIVYTKDIETQKRRVALRKTPMKHRMKKQRQYDTKKVANNAADIHA